MYYLYKLEFITPVHFGTEVLGIGEENVSPFCKADTLFSAICHEIINLYGESEIDKWKNLADKGDFLISDLFPYDSNNYYLPKPVLPRLLLDKDKEEDNNEKQSNNNKKEAKKLTHIPLSKWNEYMKFLNVEVKEFTSKKMIFFKQQLSVKVNVARNNEDNNPYPFSCYSFEENTGLYFIAKISDAEKKKEVDKILDSLGWSGIGGERSSGYGKFKVVKDEDKNQNLIEQEVILMKFLNSNNNDYKMLLSVTSPCENEINLIDKNDFYSLVERKGFILSYSYKDTPRKKLPIVMLGAGSCIKNKNIAGQIVDVSTIKDQPVYRYGKALTIGIKYNG